VTLAVPVHRGRLARRLLAVGAFLVLFSLVWQNAKGHGWHPVSRLVDTVTDADADRSILNWLSTSVYTAAAVFAWLVARGPRRRWGWYAVSGALVLVALDETTNMHDPVFARVESALTDGGWAIRAALIAGVVLGAVAVVWFLARQAPAVRWRLAGAAVLLPLFAVGVDSLGPDLSHDPAARLELGYLLKVSVEEFGELAAGVLVLDACLLAALTARTAGYSELISRPGLTAIAVLDRGSHRFLGVRFMNRPGSESGPR
jgi:hypothetical protein